MADIPRSASDVQIVNEDTGSSCLPNGDGTLPVAVQNSSNVRIDPATDGTLISTKGSVAGGTAATKSELAGGVYLTAAPTLTNGQQVALQVDSLGNLKVVPNTSATASPQTTGSGESFSKRAYQTTIEITLGSIATEQNILLFRNPNASGKTVYIRNITFTSLTSGKSCILRVYSNPTVTANGTTITPQSMYIGGGAAAALSLTTSAPTTSARGTKITVSGDTNEQAIIDYDWGLIVAANNALLITGTPAANNTNFVANIIWSEV